MHDNKFNELTIENIQTLDLSSQNIDWIDKIFMDSPIKFGGLLPMLYIQTYEHATCRISETVTGCAANNTYSKIFPS